MHILTHRHTYTHTHLYTYRYTPTHIQIHDYTDTRPDRQSHRQDTHISVRTHTHALTHTSTLTRVHRHTHTPTQIRAHTPSQPLTATHSLKPPQTLTRWPPWSPFPGARCWRVVVVMGAGAPDGKWGRVRPSGTVRWSGTLSLASPRCLLLLLRQPTSASWGTSSCWSEAGSRLVPRHPRTS